MAFHEVDLETPITRKRLNGCRVREDLVVAQWEVDRPGGGVLAIDVQASEAFLAEWLPKPGFLAFIEALKDDTA